MRLFHKGLILVITLIALQLSFAATILALHQQSQNDTKNIAHAMRVRNLLSSAIYEILRLRHTLFVLKMNDPEVERGIGEAKSAFDKLAPELKEPVNLVTTVNHMRSNLLICEMTAREGKQMMSQHIFGRYAQRDVWPKMREAMHEIALDTSQLNKFLLEEEVQTNNAIDKEGSDRRLNVVFLFTAMTVELILIAITVVWFNRDVSQRMAILLENTKRLSKELPLLPPVSGNDEISKLDDLFRQAAQAITSGAKSERDMIDKQRDVILEVNEQLEFIQSNDACLQTFGVTPEQLVQLSITDIVHKDDIADMKRQLAKVPFSDQTQFEARVIHCDGRVVDTLWSVPRADTTGSFFCIVHDISKQKQSERLRQEVLQMVGHDLKNPLNTVGGFLLLFQTPSLGQLSPAGQSIVASAAANANQMETLIKNLLNMEMIGSGRFPLRRQELALNSLLQRAADSKNDNCLQSGVGIEIAPTDIAVTGDEDTILQVLQNLLHNAILRAPSGSKIVVTSENMPDSCVVRITDYGRVIAHHQLPLLFELFHKSDEGISGLSMALCKAFMELNGGSISVQSSAKKGTTFTLHFAT